MLRPATGSAHRPVGFPGALAEVDDGLVEFAVEPLVSDIIAGFVDGAHGIENLGHAGGERGMVALERGRDRFSRRWNAGVDLANLGRFNRGHPMRTLAITGLLLSLVLPASAREEVVEIASRGQHARALLIKPANPSGSVILLAGGHGKLDIAADGKIGWGRGNQLVRTREDYARAGFITLVPDIAPGLKTPSGVVNYYRVGEKHARDIGAAVKYLRALKAPVVVVGTSRGAISAANAVAKTSGAERPDGVVFTAGMLMAVNDKTPSAQMAAGGDPKRLAIPTLVLGHKKDSCKFTLPASGAAYKAWVAPAGGMVEAVLLDGPPGSGDPCEAKSAHGFAGIDDQVVATVTGWIKRQAFSAK